MSDEQIRPPRHQRVLRAGRRGGAALAAFLLVGGTGAAAFAYWQTTSTSPDGLAVADTVQPGAQPAASAAKQDVTVSWPVSTTTGGAAVSGYTVSRYSSLNGGTAVAATGSCAGVIAALSCTEASVPNGTWYYTVTPVLGNWSGAESARSVGTISDGVAPTVNASVSPAPNAAGYNNTSPVVVTLAAQDQPGGTGVASISYSVDGGQTTTVSGATAAVSVTTDGTHTIVYTATDGAGNVSASQQVALRIDTQAPGSPTLVVPSVVNIANVSAVPLSGTAEAGSTLAVKAADGAGHSVTGTATASSTGSWSLPAANLTALNDGTITVSATAADAAGNVSPATTASLLKDTVAPAAPTLSVPAVVSSSNVSAVGVNGTAEAGSAVSLTVTDAGSAHTVTASSTADGNGNWTVAGLNLGSLSDGQLTYSAAAEDTAGNTGATATQTGTKKTTTTTPTFTTVPAKIPSDTVSAVQLAGTAAPGVGVVVSASNAGAYTASVSVTASGSGAWSATLNLGAFASGPVTFTARATDSYGNTASATATSRIGPKVVSVTLQNGGLGGTADTGDKVIVVFNEKMSPTSFCDGWTGGASTWTQSGGLSVVITRSGSNDTLTLSSTGCTTANFGTVYLGTNYTTATGGNLQFKGTGGSQASSVSLSSDQTTLTVTLGTLFKGTPATGVTKGGAATYQGTATDGTVSLGTGPSAPGSVSLF